MSTPNKKESDAVGEHQDMFDELMKFATNNAGDDMPQTVVEAIDYVANYCGDIAKGREYRPDEPKEAFPSIFTPTEPIPSVEEVVGELYKSLIEDESIVIGHMSGDKKSPVFVSHDGMNERRFKNMLREKLTTLTTHHKRSVEEAKGRIEALGLSDCDHKCDCEENMQNRAINALTPNHHD